MIEIILIVIAFIITVGGVIYFLYTKNHTGTIEVTKDKIVFISEDLKRTKNYQIGFVEDKIEINDRYILYIRPTHISINEKVSDIEVFPIVVLKSMIKESKNQKYNTMRILPFFDGNYETAIKETKYYKEMVDNTLTANVLQIQVSNLQDQLNTTIQKNNKNYDETISNILSGKGVVKKKVDEFLNQGNNPSGQPNFGGRGR